MALPQWSDILPMYQLKDEAIQYLSKKIETIKQQPTKDNIIDPTNKNKNNIRIRITIIARII